MNFYFPIHGASRSKQSRTVFVMRHCQSIYNKRRLEGISASDADEIDPPLSDEGIEEAIKLRDVVANLNVDIVLCSPLARAQQTARIVTEGGSLAPIFTVAFLRERLTHQLCDQLRPISGLDGSQWPQLLAQCETEMEFAERVKVAREYVTHSSLSRTLVVSHARFLASFAEMQLQNGAVAELAF